MRKRIISKLEVKGSNLIKGICFDGLRSLGFAAGFAKKYNDEGIDEIIYQDIRASLYKTEPNFSEIKKIGKLLDIPFVVSGGITKLEHLKKIFDLGADKISLNSGAINNLKLIEKAASIYGSQSIILSLDIFSYQEEINNKIIREVWIKNGKERTEVNYLEWLKNATSAGIGEICLTSITNDGLAQGADVNLIDEICNNSNLPIIYCGGLKDKQEASHLLKNTNIQAISISTLFHYFYYKKINNNHPKISSKYIRNPDEDLGNYEFFNNGYAGYNYLNCKPLSIREIKKIVAK